MLCSSLLDTIYNNLRSLLITQKQHQYLIALLAFLYIFLGTIPKFNVVMNYVSWFSFLYIVAAYVRMNPIKNRKWGLLTVFFILTASVSVIACLYLGDKLGKRSAYEFVSDSNTFLAFAIGFCSFMFFKDLKIKQSRVINNIGGMTPPSGNPMPSIRTDYRCRN